MAAECSASGAWLVASNQLEYREGAIVRGPDDSRRLALLFTGHEFGEGAAVILDALAAYKAKGSFFLTGVFLSNTNFAPLIQRLVREHHYVGPHSDQHLLYCPWEGPKKSLVTHAEFAADLEANLAKLARFGVERGQTRYFLPPYEHYNEEVAGWTREAGMQLINYTPGTRSHADYTGETDKNFVASDTIFDSIMRRERDDPHGLNGFLLLLHLGSGPNRQDKFHTRFGHLLDTLTRRGYRFVTVPQLLEEQKS